MIKDKIKVREQTNVPYTASFKHIESNGPVYIEPFTPTSKIIEKLEERLGIKYDLLQVRDLKQHYQKYTKGKKRKTFLGWKIEYLLDGNYVAEIDSKLVTDKQNQLLPINSYVLHESFPLVGKVKIDNKKNIEKVVTELNNNVQSLNLENYRTTKQNELEKIFEENKNEIIRWKLKDYANSILKDLKKYTGALITVDEAKDLFSKHNKKKLVHGWYVSRKYLQNN